MLISEEAQLIIKILKESSNRYQLIDLIKESFCLRCGAEEEQSDCWCDYDSPMYFERD